MQNTGIAQREADLGQRDDASTSGDVFGRFLAVGVNENIGVDRDQSGASIRS